mmetsp:Transcript_62608/g.136121  ORF Transcript_62608/g.136121 Transcript_62608/m.136121 type:complete len:196 (-) Transcript_62608:42-629(-)
MHYPMNLELFKQMVLVMKDRSDPDNTNQHMQDTVRLLVVASSPDLDFVERAEARMILWQARMEYAEKRLEAAKSKGKDVSKLQSGYESDRSHYTEAVQEHYSTLAECGTARSTARSTPWTFPGLHLREELPPEPPKPASGAEPAKEVILDRMEPCSRIGSGVSADCLSLDHATSSRDGELNILRRRRVACSGDAI